jgi:TetR/AcrR family transcriptional regulator, repressor for uid operon
MAANKTVLRILDATLTTLARRGARKLSMSDVSAQAGISRGTLYNYFTDKEDLLRAIAMHVESVFESAVITAVEKRPGLDVRLQVVMEALADVGRTHPEALQVLAVEPAFGIDFLRQIFPQFLAILEQLLTPALELTPAVRTMGLTSGQLSEMILRIVMSAYLIPSSDLADVPRAIVALPYLHEAQFDAELAGLRGEHSAETPTSFAGRRS